MFAYFTAIPDEDLAFFLVALVVTVAVLFIFRRLLKISFPYFFIGIIGLVLGLWVGAIVAQLFANLPGKLGRLLPAIVQILVAVALLDLFIAQTKPWAKFLHLMFKKVTDWALKEEMQQKRGIVVDTSIFIDGRIQELAMTGIISDILVVPQFVIDELQSVADSRNNLKRLKGRRGLNIMAGLSKDPSVRVIISKDTISAGDKVDSQLVKVAKRRGAKIMTLDYNLNKVARIAGVDVINLNEIVNALKPVVAPGENLTIKVLQKGKEAKQGVGFLPDGTMVVVEGGENLVGKEVKTKVERIFQTEAGKMIFVRPRGG